MNGRWFGAFAIVGLVACGGSSDSTAPASSVVGTWDLQTVNGSALPFVFATTQNGSSTTTREVVSETAVFASDGTVMVFTTVRTTPPGSSVVQQSTLTWTQHGTSVSFSTDFTDGSVTGNTLTRQPNSGDVYVYQRRTCPSC